MSTQAISHLTKSLLLYIWNTPFLPLIPMKSFRKHLLQVRVRRKWCGTARGAITGNPSLHRGHGFGIIGHTHRRLSNIHTARGAAVVGCLISCTGEKYDDEICSVKSGRYEFTVCVTSQHRGLYVILTAGFDNSGQLSPPQQCCGVRVTEFLHNDDSIFFHVALTSV